MSLKRRMSMLILVDSCIVLFSIYIGYFLLHPIDNPFTDVLLLISSLAIFVAHHSFAMYYGLYRKVWEYASVKELLSIFKAVTFSILIVALIQAIVTGGVLGRALFVTWMLHMLLIGGTRLSWRVLRDTFISEKNSKGSKKGRLLLELEQLEQ